MMQTSIMNMDIALNPSKKTAFFLILIHLGVVIPILFIPITLYFKFVTILLCMTSLMHRLRKDSFRTHPESIVNIKSMTKKEENDEWQLTTRSGRILNAILRGDSFITNPLLILNFNIIGVGFRKKHSLLILSDTLPDQTFRRLRVNLKKIARATKEKKKIEIFEPVAPN